MTRKQFINLIIVLILLPFIGIFKFAKYTKVSLTLEQFDIFLNSMMNKYVTPTYLYVNKRVYKLLKKIRRKQHGKTRFQRRTF